MRKMDRLEDGKVGLSYACLLTLRVPLKLIMSIPNELLVSLRGWMYQTQQWLLWCILIFLRPFDSLSVPLSRTVKCRLARLFQWYSDHLVGGLCCDLSATDQWKVYFIDQINREDCLAWAYRLCLFIGERRRTKCVFRSPKIDTANNVG